MRRVLPLAIVLFIGALIAWSIWALINVRAAIDEAREAQASVDRIDSFEIEELLVGDIVEPLDNAVAQLRSVHSRLDRPLMKPAGWLPVIGRQVRTADAMAVSLANVLDAASTAIVEIESDFEADMPLLDRIRSMSTQVAQIEQAADDSDLGPSEALFEQLAEMRAEAAERLDHLGETAGRVHTLLDALSDLLEGPENHLLLVANNAEMRAGGGMILTTGVLRTDDGAVLVTDLSSSFHKNLPDQSLELTPTYEEHFEFAEVETEWRNLGLTPRFPETAESALRMWEEYTGDRLDGVVLVDPFTLEALLAGIGAVEVDGLTYDSDNILEYILHDQYLTIDVDQTNTERRQAERTLAPAVLSAALTRSPELAKVVPALREAVAGRHLLLWSPDPARQQAWASGGVDGELEANSIALGFSNRSPSKLDYFIETRVGVKSEIVDGLRHVEVEIAIDNTVDPEVEPWYVTGPQPSDETPVEAGEYVVLVTANVPGAAVDSRFDGVANLEVAGADGPTRIVATSLSVMPGERGWLTLRFELPLDVTDMVIEPSARFWPTRWRLGDTDVRSDEPHAVNLADLTPISG